MSKDNLKRAWMEQMAYKEAHKQTDEFFKWSEIREMKWKEYIGVNTLSG